ncbi:MAG: transposase [Gammaproteobacteria bacterium]|nr:transposase [Gammaproteobacteria bacterium]
MSSATTRSQPCGELCCCLEGFYNPFRVHSALDYLTPMASER